MKTRLALILMLLPLHAAWSQSTTMGWWQNNGDSVVLGGTTVTLDGTNIQHSNGTVHDPPGTDDAWLHFTFNPPVSSFRLWVEDVGSSESITFGNPLPNHVMRTELDPEGDPIHTVRGFFYGEDGAGAVHWNGPNIASVELTLSHSSGSIRVRQLDLDPGPFVWPAVIDIRPFPFASPSGITLEMAIADPPNHPEVGSGFAVLRHALYPCDGQTATVATFPRVPGSMHHLRFTDTNVTEGTSYRYRVVPFPTGDLYEFEQLFDPTGWGFEIETFAAPQTPMTPMVLGHGKLVSFEPTGAILEPCSDSCIRFMSGFVSPDVLPYVDTNVPVQVSGDMFYAGNSYGTVGHFDTAVSTSCTVAVESSTWSNMKLLFR